MNFNMEKPAVCEVTGVKGVPEEQTVRKKYEKLTRMLIGRGITFTAMESCTSGQVASLITDTEGSSAIFKGAFVAYSNDAKIRQGVPADIIEEYGVYSAQTALSMALACRDAFEADISLGVTGSFGNPDPDNADSVPGEVWFAVAAFSEIECCHCYVPFQPSRLSYKLYMSDVIADRILNILRKTCA